MRIVLVRIVLLVALTAIGCWLFSGYLMLDWTCAAQGLQAGGAKNCATSQ